MSPLLKNLVVAFGITLVLWIAYSLFGSSKSGTVDIAVVNPELRLRSQQILSDTNTIDNYRMDTAVLSDRRFTSLTDTRVDLSALPVGTGRANPFAPVE
jgi:hypothetical protein